MKFYTFILSLFILISLASLTSATVSQHFNTYTGVVQNNTFVNSNNAINNVSLVAYNCADNNCNTVNSLFTTANSGLTYYLNINYPTALQSTMYGLYFYQDGYIPYEYYSTYAGTGQAPNANVYLYKKENCQVNVSNLIISNSSNSISVNYTINSPINNFGPLNYIPAEIKSNYQSNVITEINLTSSNLNQSVSLNRIIDFSSYSAISKIFNSLNNGSYTIKITAYANDSKCVNSPISQTLSTVQIGGLVNATTNNTNLTLPTIQLISPIDNHIYNSTIIPIIINATNYDAITYSNGSSNFTYTSPVNFTFKEGNNTLYAYANNSNGMVSHMAIFYVNSSSNNATIPTNNTNTTIPNNQTNTSTNTTTNNTYSGNTSVIIYINGTSWLSFISPANNIIYNASTIPIIINSSDYNNTIWSNGSSNFTYTAPINFTFKNGTNRLYAYLNNTNISIMTTFVINLVGNSTTNNTTTNTDTSTNHGSNRGSNSYNESVIVHSYSTSSNKTLYITNSSIALGNEAGSNISASDLNKTLLILLSAILIVLIAIVAAIIRKLL